MRTSKAREVCEIAQEGVFARVQQIVVTLGEPRQRALEVQQVIRDIRADV
jgi:hypothetical protein